jgi:RHS repeat-associated protein
MNYGDVYAGGSSPSLFPTFAVIPVWNIRGKARYVMFSNGSRTLTGPYGQGDLGTAWQLAKEAYGPANNAEVTSRSRMDHVWLGSVMNDQQDASGLLYRRNRYYDPATGRFTQEDPIGLAGGLNLYGFANGDPVSYSDPYGLCKRPKGSGVGICLETFIQGRFFGVGDNRGPSATGGTYKSSISFSFDPRSGTMSGVSTDIGYTKGKKGTGFLDVSASADPTTGAWTISMSGSAKNGEGVGPAIDFEINLHVGFDGNVTMAGGSHDGFPSDEVWVYKDGQQPQNIYYHDQGNRTNIRKLFPPNDKTVPHEPHQ